MRARVLQVALTAGVPAAALEAWTSWQSPLAPPSTPAASGAKPRGRGDCRGRGRDGGHGDGRAAGRRRGTFAGEVLGALAAAGVRTGIVTRNCRRATAAALVLLGHACPVVLTREDVASRSRDPAHLLEALRRLDAHPRAR